MKPAVFLDRDGTVSEEVGYVNHIDRFHVFSWTGRAIRKLNQAGLKTVVLTNQSGVARGYFPETLIHEVHDKLKLELARSEAYLDAIYYCPHHPEGNVAQYCRDCECRKPGIGMIQRAVQELNLDLSSSCVIGDRYIDLQMGFAAGIRSILVLSGYGRGELHYQKELWARQPDHTAENLDEAVDWVLTKFTH
jgi:D-glycero-D-manno-heptose 1,7-bisphosphate phosphatase